MILKGKKKRKMEIENEMKEIEGIGIGRNIDEFIVDEMEVEWESCGSELKEGRIDIEGEVNCINNEMDKDMGMKDDGDEEMRWWKKENGEKWEI